MTYILGNITIFKLSETTSAWQIIIMARNVLLSLNLYPKASTLRVLKRLSLSYLLYSRRLHARVLIGASSIKCSLGDVCTMTETVQRLSVPKPPKHVHFVSKVGLLLVDKSGASLQFGSSQRFKQFPLFSKLYGSVNVIVWGAFKFFIE